MEFISKAMFDEQPRHAPESAKDKEMRIATAEANKNKVSSPSKQSAGTKMRPDFCAEELTMMQESELKRIFSLVNRNSPSGCVSRSEFELLLLTLLGFELPAHGVEGCLRELRTLSSKTGINVRGDGSIPFELFLLWWTTGDSAYLENNGAKK